MTQDVLGVVILVIMVGATAFTGLAVFEQTADATGAHDNVTASDAAILEGPGTGSPVGSQMGTGEDETVVNSRGHAYQFTGAGDSYLTSSGAVALDNESWSVMQGVWVNASATGQNMTVLAIGDPDLILEYRGNQSSPTWSAFYYEGTNSYRVEVTAPDPTNASVVWVTKEQDTLTIHRNTTSGAAATVGSESTASGDLTGADNCHCRLDETRLWESYIDSSTRTGLVENPVQATAPGTQKAGRILFDRTGPIQVFDAGVSVSGSNVTLGPGFAGQTMDRDGLVSTGDYHWRSSGPEIRPTAGGRLEHAPIAFVDYTRAGEGRSWSRDLNKTMSSFSMVFSVLALIIIISYLRVLK